MRYRETCLSACFFLRDLGFETENDALSNYLYNAYQRIDDELTRAKTRNFPSVPLPILRVLLRLVDTHLPTDGRIKPYFAEQHVRLSRELREAVTETEKLQGSRDDAAPS
jgi:hypothetical protein